MRFAPDSPLEGAVSSEPVSAFVAGKIQGISSDSGLGDALNVAKRDVKSELYERIPYASERGIFCGLTGN